MKKLIAIVLFILFINGTSLADTKGSISGRISDQNGKPLADVRVEVQNTSITTRTLSDGTFVLKDLEPAKYFLVFVHPDYTTEKVEIIVGDKPGKMIKVALLAKNPMLLAIREEITITAEADSIIDVSLPSHRTILPSSVIAELGVANVAEALDKVPGVTMVGKGGYSMAPAIRGLAEHRILLLVDGVRLTSERRIGASASFINLNDIDRIEVNRGPYSVFHGSGAVGGIVNIITKSPIADAPFMGNGQISYNTIRKERAASLNLSGSRGKFGFMIGMNGKKAADYRAPKGKIEQSRYSDLNFMLKVNREGDESRFYLTFFNYIGNDIGKPSPSSKFKPRWYPKERNTIFTLGYKIQNKLHFDNLETYFYLYLSTLETQKKNLRESLTVKQRNLAKIDGTNFGFKVRGGKTIGKSHILTIGLDFYGRRHVNDKNTEWTFDEVGSMTNQTEETSLLNAQRDNFGLYIDDKIYMSSSITMNLGARFDLIDTSNFTSTGERISRNDQFFSAYVGSAFKVTPHLSVLANVGRSFRFPTVSELFYSGLTGRGTVFGNTSLNPEKGLNVDFGLRYFHDKFFGSIYAFCNSISDMIQKYSDGTDEEYYYRNLTRGRIIGVEGEFYFSLIDDLEFFINFHHMRGRERGTQNELNYVPASRITLWTKFSHSEFWVEPKVTLAAAKKDPGPLEREIDGYALIDTIFGYEINQNLTILAIAKNMLNQTYRFSADVKGVDAPGRTVVFKVLFSF